MALSSLPWTVLVLGREIGTTREEIWTDSDCLWSGFVPNDAAREIGMVECDLEFNAEYGEFVGYKPGDRRGDPLFMTDVDWLVRTIQKAKFPTIKSVVD